MNALGFDVGMRAAAAAVRAFDPAMLFAGGAPGGWWEPGDGATLFADADGTTPAATDGPVGRMLDKSGRGNAVTQGAAASRPILRRDANGRGYLAFDGVDDRLCSMAAELRITGAVTLAAAVRRAASGTYDMWITAQTSAGTVNPYELRTDPSGQVEFVGAGAASYQISGSGLSVPAGAAAVVTGARTGAAIEFTAGAGASSVTHAMVPTSDAATEFRLGSRKGSPLFANGRLYAALVIGRLLSPAEAGALREHFAALVSVGAG